MTYRDDIIGQISESFRDIAQAIATTTTPEWLDLDLTMAQLKALFALSTGPETVGALSQKLGIHLSAASHVADRLVQLGIAERYEDSEDRRRTFVRLSDRGSGLVNQLRQGKNERFHGWLDILNDDDLTALYRGIQAFATAVMTPRG